MFKQKLNGLVIDDSIGMHHTIKQFFSCYTQKFINKNEININYLPFEYCIDYFFSVEEFIKNKKDYYDFYIIDWNLAGKGAANIKERGDVVIRIIGNNCKLKIILTGMIDDVINPESELCKMLLDYKDLIIKSKYSNTLDELYDILKIYFS